MQTLASLFLKNCIECIGVTLVNKIIQVSGVSFSNTSSVYCIVCSPLKVKFPSITIYAPFPLSYLRLPPTPPITTLLSVSLHTNIELMHHFTNPMRDNNLKSITFIEYKPDMSLNVLQGIFMISTFIAKARNFSSKCKASKELLVSPNLCVCQAYLPPP